MDGLINLLKPPGLSSHQVVSLLRRKLGTKRIGHGGTLDPGASGVLPIMVGKATKLSAYLTEWDKTYIAELTLGFSTTTQDASGATVDVNYDFSLTPRELADALATFQGPIWQTPPMASAVQVGGKRLYELQRQGVTVKRQARQALVHSILIRRIWGNQEDRLGFGSRVLLEINCSKGTYIRTLGHDLGVKLGVWGHLSFLTRTRSGPFSSTEATTLEEIAALTERGEFSFLAPLSAGLPDWPQVRVNPLVETRLKHGAFILPEHFVDVPAALAVGERVVLLSIDGTVLALAEIQRTDQLICQPFTVLVG